ncbi:protein of unknown function [Bradyrhizobium vignae]|uniref:Uncharacterized protein n=1 Tax=Bradyrhizobium vignae TaxID=1549949 RepID=A0A2U3Q1Q0_9BRAD|nr:protein of unknown function [Bradyrhizobium vignae]
MPSKAQGDGDDAHGRSPPELLTSPVGRVRVVLDTDIYNEIDNQFVAGPDAAVDFFRVANHK